MQQRITPQLVLSAYCQGLFPMADGREGEIGWYSPDPRAVQPFAQGDPLGSFKVRRSLAKRVRNGGFELMTDRCFPDVIHACASVPRNDELGTWISPEIERLYTALHRHGFAHSVEAWHGGELVGGLYGVAIGAAFFGESMFSRRPDASKVALAFLAARLRQGGFTLFDTQFVTAHLLTLGAEEIPRAAYHKRLREALRTPARFDSRAPEPSAEAAARLAQEAVQRSTHRS
jgi:leucyl/phenylalanyl-tRNA--protein transferase